MATTSLLGAGVGHLGTGEASAAFAPRSGPLFNDPESTHSRQYAIVQQIEDNIAAAPKGSVIRVAVYSMDLDAVADALIAAHRRGVYVKVLMDQHAENDLWHRLVAELGGKVSTKSASSYAVLCYGGCVAHHYSGGAPAAWLHAKYYLFSGGGKPTVTLTSANPTAVQAEVTWNNSYTVVGNSGLYNAYVKHFTDMSKGAAGTHKAGYYWTYGSNPKAYYWPKASGASDTIDGMLKLITCSTAYPTQVRIAMYQWSDNRLTLAKRLKTMASKGCKITVIYTKDEVSSGVRTTLAGSKIDVRDSTHGTTADGYAAYYTHDKYLLINGRYNGASGQKIVMTGSANYTANALYHNDETDMKLTGSSAYDAYLANFDDQLATASAATAKERALDHLPTIPIDPEQAEDS
ncbi:phospholipase D-like domain-containing protein [Actinomadura sp. DC4]|uniref:phospholipase D-like domain-containing protein n=1 Tax=Actinomadura sp. DC4 TaxID=3055069 RepID=UPI0025AFC8C9|nr:phospholipase D-like domain-containing protein [Actinomadura sp. DC4]MDN3355145.1 phospholipase D-like domain-containing protein [Actinomadura sp. DC4]